MRALYGLITALALPGTELQIACIYATFTVL